MAKTDIEQDGRRTAWVRRQGRPMVGPLGGHRGHAPWGVRVRHRRASAGKPGRRRWLFTAVHRYAIAPEAGGCKVTYTEDLTRLQGAPRMLRTPGVPQIMFRSPTTPSSSRPLGRW